MSIPMHISGMENIKGQQQINAILNSVHNSIDNHKWTETKQSYARLYQEKYLEAGGVYSGFEKPADNINIVGYANNRPLKVGVLDTNGDLYVDKDFYIRDNLTKITKTWDVLSGGDAGSTPTVAGSMWDVVSYKVGVRNPQEMQEVKSIPNDIKDPLFSTTIYNQIINKDYGWLDIKTFEKNEYTYRVVPPTYTLQWLSSESGWIDIGNYSALDIWRDADKYLDGKYMDYPSYGYPAWQINEKNAMYCWSPLQIYVETRFNPPYHITPYNWWTFSTYEQFLAKVKSYSDNGGRHGTGLTIPSYQFMTGHLLQKTRIPWVDQGIWKSGRVIRVKYVDASSVYVSRGGTYWRGSITRRYVAEVFEKVNGGLVDIDVSYRV